MGNRCCCSSTPGIPKAGDKLKLSYFDGPGRANLSRLTFTAGGVAFEDDRTWDFQALQNAKTDFSTVPGELFGVLPVIKHGDFILGQSIAIACYAAELGVWRGGRLGTDPVEIARNRATEIMFAVTNEDIRADMYKCLFGSDEGKEAAKKMLPEAVRKPLNALERTLERKKVSGPFVVSEDGPTLADLAIYDNVVSPFPGLKALGVSLDAYPKISAVVEAVKNNQIAKTPAKTIAKKSQKLVLGGEPLKLTYFNGAGRANFPRLALAAGGVKYEDDRSVTMDGIKGMKTDLSTAVGKLFGSVPVIQHGDFVLGQSIAVACYCAELGIWKDRLGTDPQEIACNRAIDIMVAVTNEDLRVLMYGCLFGPEDSKETNKKELPGKAKKFLAPLERALARKLTSGPFFFSQNGPSLADLAVYDNVTSPFPGLRALGVQMDAYPKVMQLVDAVAKDPKVSACKV